MKNRIGLAIMLLWPSLSALAEGAQEGHGEAAGWGAPIWGVPTIAWQIINTLLVVVLFVFLLRRPAPKFFAGRAKEIQDLLEKALKEKEEATRSLREIEAKMARLDEEVAAIERSAREAAEADKVRLYQEAEAAKARIQQEAGLEMERQLVQAKRDLRAYAADLAVRAAREILSRSLTPEDEARIQERFLNLMEGRHERRG